MISKSGAKDLVTRSMRHGYDHHGGANAGSVPCPVCHTEITGYAHPSEPTAMLALRRTLFAHLYPIHLGIIIGGS